MTTTAADVRATLAEMEANQHEHAHHHDFKPMKCGFCARAYV